MSELPKSKPGVKIFQSREKLPKSNLQIAPRAKLEILEIEFAWKSPSVPPKKKPEMGSKVLAGKFRESKSGIVLLTILAVAVPRIIENVKYEWFLIPGSKDAVAFERP